MTFRYSEQNREEYFKDDITILRGVIPATLLTDLRRESEKAREIARNLSGAQAQRLQPIRKYAELDQRPFDDCFALPELLATVTGILGADHSHMEGAGILFEPKDNPWTTGWHRDWGYNYPGIDLDAFFHEVVSKPLMFNQFNAALYDDRSFWVVPGSGRRGDTEAEQDLFVRRLPKSGPELFPGMTQEEKELACMAHTRLMPNAVNIVLSAGDIAFYRAVSWHTGNYVPYVKRATLHSCFDGPEDREWKSNVPLAKAKQLQK